MKKIILLATAFIMASCGFMQNSSSSNTADQQTVQTGTSAKSAGKNAGNALQALYTQYKADGKYDYKNMQNAFNTITLIANCEDLKENYKDNSYLTEFGKGLIASSSGLVTKNNVGTITDSLVDMIKNSESVKNVSSKAQNVATQTAQYATTAAVYANSISNLLSLFGNK